MSRRNQATGRYGPARGQQIRIEIAQAAAKLIVEHGLDDWAHAKRKAARQLGVNEQSHLPSKEELEQAIREYNDLYRAQSQADLLREGRTQALAWMRRLAAFAPQLTAGFATGLAGAHSEIRIEVVADDSQAVELFLLSRDVRFQHAASIRGAGDSTQYLMEADGAMLRLTVVTSAQRRNIGRERLDERLDTAELETLLGACRA